MIAIVLTVCMLFSCQKENIDADSSNMATLSTADQTLLLEGTFMNGGHTTSGIAKIYEDKNKKRTLVFENFKTDAGPDLRIYLAEDKSASNFIQISNKVQNGNIQLSIPDSADLSKQMHILIWCKQFSVLFGSAQLK